MPVSVKPPQRNFLGKSADVRQGERRRRLLEASIRAFGSRGYHAVTVRGICAEAALTERYFYESFDSLEELFGSVYAQLNAELKAVLMAAVPPNPDQPLELASAMLRAFLEYMRRDPLRARIMLIDAVNIGQDVMRLAGGASEDYVGLVGDLLASAFGDALELAGLQARWLARGLVGAQIQITTYWVRERFSTPLDVIHEHLLVLYRALIELAMAERAAAPRAGRPRPKRRRRR